MGGEYVILELVQHEILESPVKVYNLNVDEDHTYFVSANGVLVHNVCGGETRATKYGREQHKNWDYGGPVKKEVSIPGAGRADAVDYVNRIVYELKPNNTRAIRQGWRQLTRYQNALERELGGTWIRILELYES